MSEKPENPPAFPRDHRHLGHNGMDLRDYFAGQVISYAASRDYGNDWGRNGREHPIRAASFAYAIADAMLAERAKAEGR